MSELLHRPMAITAEERARRQDILDEARGSVRLEGIELDDTIVAIGQRYVAGEITLAEHGELIRRYVDA